MSNLRGFQQKLKNDANDAFAAGHRSVMMQLSTGGGKTVVMGDMARDHEAAPWDRRYPGGAALAHRSELVSQISQQLAREDVAHDIIAPKNIIRGIVNNHMEEFGRTFYNARAPWRVASIDTIVRRGNVLASWLPTVGQLFIDEAHHVLKSNKWGTGVEMFPNARVLLPTATPIRADGKGLGRHADGIADALVEGPPMRWLIDNGYLTDYKIYTIPPSDLNLSDVTISASGDFNPAKLREAVHKSSAIVGDVVRTYLEHARGKLGITFAVDVKHGQEIADAFNRAGVPAVLLTGETDPDERNRALRKFRNRELLQLVNVDLFDEGFDLPAIECVSFARPTASFAKYSQMWGRALRLMISKMLAAAWDTYTPTQRKRFIAESGKPFAFIFDHAGNFYRHEGPPDKPRVWSLHGRSKRAGSADDGIPMRVCLNVTCAQPYERIHPECPYCGMPAPLPAPGGAVTVDGDIREVDPAMLARWRGEVARIDAPPVVPNGAPRMPVIANHMKRQRAQHHLREAIAYWAGSYPADSDVANHRRFWFAFKLHVVQAMSLNEADADALREKILADLEKRSMMTPVINELETIQ